MSSKRVNKTNSNKQILGSFLSHPLLLIWLFLAAKVKLRVAVSASYTEITTSQSKVLAHRVNPFENNS